MKLSGKVTSGLGKASFFLSQDFYVNNFLKRCGFKPYPGTLNIIIEDDFLYEINRIKEDCDNIIKPDEGFGAVKFINAVLNDEINGAIVFPAKSQHSVKYLEFIADIRLRDYLNLEDGNIVTVEFGL